MKKLATEMSGVLMDHPLANFRPIFLGHRRTQRWGKSFSFLLCFSYEECFRECFGCYLEIFKYF